MNTDLTTPALLNYQPRGVLNSLGPPLDLISLDAQPRIFRLRPVEEYRLLDEVPPLEITHE